MTVQEIQEIGFEKAVFGGYDMGLMGETAKATVSAGGKVSSLPCRRKTLL